jgi:hypothetical protein
MQNWQPEGDKHGDIAREQHAKGDKLDKSQFVKPRRRLEIVGLQLRDKQPDYEEHPGAAIAEEVDEMSDNELRRPLASSIDGSDVIGDTATATLGEETYSHPPTSNTTSFPGARWPHSLSRRESLTTYGNRADYPEWMREGWLGKLTYEEIKNLPEGTLPPIAPPPPQ